LVVNSNFNWPNFGGAYNGSTSAGMYNLKGCSLYFRFAKSPGRDFLIGSIIYPGFLSTGAWASNNTVIVLVMVLN